MTNKEAKEKLYMEWQKFLEDNIDYAGISDAYKMAIKALEQQDALDKIRAEIETARFIDKDTKLCKNANASGLEVAMQIIDKYAERK